MHGSPDEDRSRSIAYDIADLHDYSEHTAQAAYERLIQADPDTILEQLLAAHHNANASHVATWTTRRVLLSLSMGAAGYLLFRSMSTCNTDVEAGAAAFIFGVLCAMVAGYVFIVARPSRASIFNFRSINLLLCRCENPRAVGALCDSLRSQALKSTSANGKYGDLRSQVLQALTRLLPRVTGGPDDDLTTDQLAVLRSELRRVSVNGATDNADISLALATLQCIQRLGDIASIRDVERLHIYRPGTPSGQMLAKQKEECLEALYRLRAMAGEALLRGSESPDKSAELLRHAKPPEADAEHLMRAAGEPEDEDVSNDQELPGGR